MHKSHNIEGTGQCFMSKVELMYFLVNESPPKLLDVATSNFAGA